MEDDEEISGDEDEEPVLYSVKSKNKLIVKGVDKLTDSLTRNVKRQVGSVKIRVNVLKMIPQGIELELEVSKEELKGNAVVKIFGPNARKGYSVIVSKCVECDFKGRNRNGLKIHRSLKHMHSTQLDGHCEDDSENPYSVQSNISVESQTGFKCERCEFVTENNDILRDHIESKHKNLQFWDCDYCD